MNFVKEIKLEDHSYGIDEDGTLFVKGKNYYNMLGIPDYRPIPEYKRIENEELDKNVLNVYPNIENTFNMSHTVFILTKNHCIYATGDNSWNQTGINQSKKIEREIPPKYKGDNPRYEAETLMINRLFEWTKLTNDISEWPIERNVESVKIVSDKTVYLKTMDGKILKAGMENGGYILTKWTLLYPNEPNKAIKEYCAL